MSIPQAGRRPLVASLLFAPLLSGCATADRPVRGLWSGSAHVTGTPATRVRLDGPARCLILRRREDALRLRLEGKAPRGPVVVRIVDMDADVPRLLTTASVPVSGGVFRHDLQLSRDALGGTSWLGLEFDLAGLELETLEPVERQLRPKLVVLALDGATWRILDPLLKAGRLPHVKALLERGAAGPLLTIKPTLSPVVWTSIASGRQPGDHGIWDFFDAQKRIVNSSQVKAKRIWEIASERGAATLGVVGWFVTWPVERIAGFMVSDRAKGWRPSGEDRPSAFYPAQLQRPFEALLAERRARLVAEAGRFTPMRFDPDWKTRLLPGDPGFRRHDRLENPLLRVYLRDSAFVEAGLRYYAAFEPDLFLLYLRGADETQHSYWFERAPEESLTAVDAEDQRLFGSIIDSYHVYLDEAIGRFMAAARADTVFMLVSDHGFRSFVRERGGERRSIANHEPEGVYLFSGPGFRRNLRSGPISVLDLCPLWLYQLGLPAAADMPGRLPLELLAPGAPQQPERIASYGARSERAFSRSGDADAEVVEQLKALGYIE